MKKFLLCIALCALAHEAAAQVAAYYVVGNGVNVRRDTTLETRPLFKASWGTKYMGEFESPDWFASYNEITGRKYFIHAKYVVDYSEFCARAETHGGNSSLFKLQLLRCHLHTASINREDQVEEASSFDNALALAGDLITNNTNDNITEGYEKCDLAGHMAYYTLMEGTPKERRVEIAHQLLERATDPALNAVILLDQTKYLIAQEEWEAAEDNVLKVIASYADHLMVPIPCDYDVDSKVYPVRRLKELMATLYNIEDRQMQFEEKLLELTNSNQPGTKMLAEGMMTFVSGKPWGYKEYWLYHRKKNR